MNNRAPEQYLNFKLNTYVPRAFSEGVSKIYSSDFVPELFYFIFSDVSKGR